MTDEEVTKAIVLKISQFTGGSTLANVEWFMSSNLYEQFIKMTKF
jgi:hypothetical protein